MYIGNTSIQSHPSRQIINRILKFIHILYSNFQLQTPIVQNKSICPPPTHQTNTTQIPHLTDVKETVYN